jgi:polysaccharide biosynthesis/export protein
VSVVSVSGPIRYVLLLLLVSGCTTNGPNISGTAAPHLTQTSLSHGEDYRINGATSPAAVNAIAPATSVPTFTATKNEDYRLSPLDTIEVSVFQVPDLQRTVQVSASGLVTLPLIGTVTAGGKTVREFQEELTKSYGGRFLQSPQISVFVKEYTSQRVTVEGAVNSPGVYQFTGSATLLQAIALARGITREADPGGVMIFRTIDGQRTGAVFDVNPIRKGVAADPTIIGGDMVVVDQSVARTVWRDIRESIGVAGFFRPVLF